MAALDSHQRGDFALFTGIADFRRCRRKDDVVRMLANLFTHRIDLNKRAIHCLGPGNFAGHPDGKENRAEVAIAHAGDVYAPGSAARAKIELAVQKPLRGVVMRVHDDRREMQFARFFRDGIGGDGKSGQANRRNTHYNEQQCSDHALPP